MPTEFRVLGTVEALVDHLVLDLGHARQRCVLAVLLAEPNRTVTVDQMVDRVWGDRPAQRARGALHSYVSRLRRLLSADTEVEITRTGGGYRLRLDALAVDLHRFDHLVAQARSAESPGRLLDTLEDALALWRGEPFTNMHTEWFDDLRTDLINRRWAVELERNEAALALGRHASLLGTLTASAAAHPYDERLAGQLILALYRSGRQADALAHYDQVRRLLADELGTDPGAALRRLHQQVLTGDEVIAAPTPSVSLNAAQPKPQQLPTPLRSFVERTAVLSRLDELATTARAGVIILSGMPGVGKTALAVHWAHRVADQFPDGQLFLHLGGFAAIEERMEPGRALREILRALHVPPEGIPASLSAQSALYRSIVSDRRMLVVLDDADNADQVRPLLSASLTLITSRHRMHSLVALEDAELIEVGVFDTAEARTMLTRRLGRQRLAAEPASVDALAELCAGLPLALAVVAARAVAHPGFRLDTLAAQLRGTRDTLDGFAADDPAADIRAVFSWSYRRLTPAAARAFRLFGLVAGPHLSSTAAASLAGDTVRETDRLLAELVRTRLVDEEHPGHFSLHDLMRAYAVELIHQIETEEQRRQAQTRLWNHYVLTARAAALLLDPHRAPITVPPQADGVLLEPLTSQPAAMAWLTAEFSALLATIGQMERAGDDRSTWQLAWSLSTFCNQQGHWHEWIAVSTAALRATERLDDHQAEALARHGLARAWTQLDRLDEAEPHYLRAIDLFHRLGDAGGEASVRASLAWALERRERYAEALTHAEHALQLARSADNAAAEARALNAVGWYQSLLGRHREALAACEQALVMLQKLDNVGGQAATWDSLGYIRHQLGETEQSIDCYNEALQLLRAVGDRYNESQVLTHLGDAHHSAGQPAAARTAWESALAILTDLRHRDADSVRARLDDAGGRGSVVR